MEVENGALEDEFSLQGVHFTWIYTFSYIFTVASCWFTKGETMEKKGKQIGKGWSSNRCIDYRMYVQRKQFTILCTVNPKREQ